MGAAGSATLFFLLLSVPTSQNEAGLPATALPLGFTEYRVRPNDTLGRIAPREHWQLIMKVNRLDAQHLPAGRKIMVPHDLVLAEKFSPMPTKIADQRERVIIISLTGQYFGAYANGYLAFWGPISSGRDGYATPTGHFSVLWKSKDYYSKKYKAEMPYAVSISSSGYFLHAQSLPGRRASHGCIRLLESDAMRLFYWVKKSDPVDVLTDIPAPTSG